MNSDGLITIVLPAASSGSELPREKHRRRFWASIAAGLSSEDAAMGVGVSQPVGFRWFREAGGMPPSHLSRSSKPLSGRYLSFAEREEIALLRAQGHGRAGGRPPPGAGAVDDLARAAAQRGDAGRRPGVPGDDRAVARRARRRAGPSRRSSRRTPRCGRTCRSGWPAPCRRSGWDCAAGAGRALEGAAARAAAEPAMGYGVEPAADRRAPAARLPGRRGDADQPRGHLPGALRPGPRRAAARADRVPAHRPGAAGAAGAHARTGQVLRHARRS